MHFTNLINVDVDVNVGFTASRKTQKRTRQRSLSRSEALTKKFNATRRAVCVKKFQSVKPERPIKQYEVSGRLPPELAGRIRQFANVTGHFWDPNQLLLTREKGLVSRNFRKLFGPEKPFVKVRATYSVKLVSSYVVKGIKVKITAKFLAARRPSFWRYKENYVTRNASEMFRDFRETGTCSGST